MNENEMQKRKNGKVQEHKHVEYDYWHPVERTHDCGVHLPLGHVLSKPPVKIGEFFDPYSIEHIKAYVYLQKEGYWPEGFIPEGTIFSTGWHFLILAKLADCWVKEKMDGEITMERISRIYKGI